VKDSKRRAKRRPTKNFDLSLVRAVVWLASVTLIAAIVISLSDNGDAFHLRDRNTAGKLELIAIAATAIAAIIAAFLLAEPRSSTLWSTMAIPPIVLWLAVCAVECLNRIARDGPGAWEIEGCLECVLFLLAVSIPLGTSLILFLHRASRAYLVPVRAAALGGIGVAAIAIGLLQFDHAVQTNLADLTAHVIAASIIIGAITYSTRLLPRIRS
jgi:hypothetical protein